MTQQFNDFQKFDEKKPDYSFLEDFHPGVLDDVMRILEFGAKKYARSNWTLGVRDYANFRRRCYAAAFRHLLAALRFDGSCDKETGLPHACAVIVNMMFAESVRRTYESKMDPG